MITNALPTTVSVDTDPKYRLSWLEFRLSPITNISPAGTTTGPKSGMSDPVFR